MRAVQVLLAAAAVAVPFGLAQQSPFVTVAKFDRSQTFRTNVCERQRLLWNNSLLLPDALRGLDLTVAITDYHFGTAEDAFFSLDLNGQIREREYPGIFAVMMDEVAARAGFRWRNSFAVYPPLDPNGEDGNKTWTDILHWAVDSFDISMEKWGHSTQRMSLGITFPLGWYDSSITLVELFGPGQEKRDVNLWSFLSPFDNMVWLMILLAIIFSGMLYWLLEYLDVDADDLDLEEKPITSIFYAAITFTGHFEFKPRTPAARIFGVSWTFWAIVVVSTYTANLASFLVSPRVVSYRYSTMEDVTSKGASLCVQGNAVIQTILGQKYPGLTFVGKRSEQEIFEGLRLDKLNGGCDAVAHQFNTYTVYKRNKHVNSDCAIASEERLVRPLPAGMATAIDTGLQYCTSLISHVLDYHLTQMRADGFIEKAWNNHVNRLATIECLEENRGGGGGDEDDTFSLTLQDVGGIFIMHFILSGAAMTMALFQFYRMRNMADGTSRTGGNSLEANISHGSTGADCGNVSHGPPQKRSDMRQLSWFG